MKPEFMNENKWTLEHDCRYFDVYYRMEKTTMVDQFNVGSIVDAPSIVAITVQNSDEDIMDLLKIEVKTDLEHQLNELIL